MEDRKKALLHVETLALLLRGVGIDRMMAYHDNPVFLGILQSFIEPGELSLSILLAGIRIDFRILAVRINKGRGVEEDDTHGSSFVVEHLGVIFGWHHPAAAHLAVVHKSLGITTILMVTTNREPVEHQVGMRINPFVIGKPQRVLSGSHAIEMVDVAHGKYAFWIYRARHLAHQFGNRLLVVVAVATHVIGHVEGDFALQFLPFSSIRLPVRILRNRGCCTLRTSGYCCVLRLSSQATAQQ